jgi:hypothetical protein
VITAPAASCGCSVSSSARLAAGGAASTSSSAARATSAARAGASSIAPRCAAVARSAGSGDQPSTFVIPARFASSASEPPIAPRPMMPRVEGRTGRKLAVNGGPVNEKGATIFASPVTPGRSRPEADRVNRRTVEVLRLAGGASPSPLAGSRRSGSGGAIERRDLDLGPVGERA